MHLDFKAYHAKAAKGRTATADVVLSMLGRILNITIVALSVATTAAVEEITQRVKPRQRCPLRVLR